MLPTPTTPTLGSSAELSPPASAKNNEVPLPLSLIIPEAPPPVSQKKNAKSPSQASLVKRRRSFHKLSNVAMINFLKTHLETEQVDQLEFQAFGDFVQKKQKY